VSEGVQKHGRPRPGFCSRTSQLHFAIVHVAFSSSLDQENTCKLIQQSYVSFDGESILHGHEPLWLVNQRHRPMACIDSSIHEATAMT